MRCRLLRAELLLPSSFRIPYASSPQSPGHSNSWTISPSSPRIGSPRGLPAVVEAAAANIPAVPFAYDFLREDDCPQIQVTSVLS